MGYGRKKLKDIVENEAEEEKEFTVQQQYDEQYDIVPKIKLVYEGKRVKEFRVTGNLNYDNTKMIMYNITPHIEMREKVIHSSKS